MRLAQTRNIDYTNNQLLLLVWWQDLCLPRTRDTCLTAWRLIQLLACGHPFDLCSPFGTRACSGLMQQRCKIGPTAEGTRPIFGGAGYQTRLCRCSLSSPGVPLLASSCHISSVFFGLLNITFSGYLQRRAHWVSGSGRSFPTPFGNHWGHQLGYPGQWWTSRKD